LDKTLVAVDDEVRAESMQGLLDALVPGGVGELEHGGERCRRRRDEDSCAAQDEPILDAPWGPTRRSDGVPEALQVGVVLQLGAEVGEEAERQPGDSRS